MTTKAAPSIPTVRGTPTGVPGSAEPGVRYVSAAEAFESAICLAERVLPEFVRRLPDGTTGWLSSEVLLPLGTHYGNLVAARSNAPIRAEDLDTWASAIALLRWGRGFIDAISPYLFDPTKTAKEDPFPPISRNAFEVRVHYEVERLRFRVDQIVQRPVPTARAQWIEGVVGYGWKFTDGRTVAYPFRPEFIDSKGRRWNLPKPTGPFDPYVSEFTQMVLGWLGTFRFEAKHPTGARNRIAYERVVALLDKKPKQTGGELRYRLELEGVEPLPSVRTIRLWTAKRRRSGYL